ncbi:MAG: hypothetical protein KF745_04125 [Phycisphaeraceae bacterium]|nr:hypothetical protein [Phycisphaeraceae bacterium]
MTNRAVLLVALAGLVFPATTLVGGGPWPKSQAVATGAPCDDPTHLGFDDHVGCGKAAMLRARFLAGQSPSDEDGVVPSSAPGLREPLEATDVLHNKIDIEIVTASPNIAGSNTFTVASRMNGLTEFTFRLRSNFTVSAATLNGTTPVPVTNLTTTSRKVTLDRPYNSGEVFTLRIDYSGTPVSRGFGSIEFTTQNGQPLVASLSEAYFAYTWWPCKDGDFGVAGDNSDKSTFEIFITAPTAMRSVANGLLQGVDTLSGNRRRHRWATNYPMSTYLACFASTNYNTWTQMYTYPLPGGGTGSMPVEFNIYPASDNSTNRAAWEKCVQMLDTYRPIFGLYPFINEKYGIYQFPFGGGMEHQTNTGQGTFDESVTAHELGHQWWGDNVTCRTWSDIWLNEGFATYSEALWAERKPGSSGLPALFAAMAARRPSQVNDSVYCYNTADMNRIFSSTFTYRKGAWVLHQLRHVVGDSVFFNILANYRAAYEGSAATTADFAAIASSTAGTDLSWFFDQWVMQIGAPAYNFGYQPVTIGGQPYARISLQQVQNASYPVFTMPIDIRVDEGAGSEQFTVWNDAPVQHFLLPLSAPATGIAFDENAWILSTANTQVPYVAGPPKVVAVSPALGSTLPGGTPVSQATIAFSDNVAIPAGSITLTGPAGAVPVSVSYSPATYVATLSFPALAPGAYTITVPDTITAGSIALDGEVVAAAALPSGNGLPGGSLVATFAVQSLVAPCSADWDQSGAVEPADIAGFVNAWSSGLGSGGLQADFDGNGVLEPSDIAAFISAWVSQVGGAC